MRGRGRRGEGRRRRDDDDEDEDEETDERGEADNTAGARGLTVCQAAVADVHHARAFSSTWI